MINFLDKSVTLSDMSFRMRNLAPSLIVFMALPISLSLVRLLLATTDSYVYLNWNLFLALLPVLFAWLYVKNLGGKWVGILWFLLWLGFLPNAPYLITDLIHLAEVGPRSLIWFDSLMLFGYAWIGMLAWLISVRMMYEKIATRSFIPVISFLTALGIFVGRYIRHNTWDMVTRPFDVLKTFISFLEAPLSHQPLLGFVLVFWLFLMFSYLGYSNIHLWAPPQKIKQGD
jgi:uncharacterized membrane protein